MIKGQVAIVTGGSRGIGAAVAKRLAGEGVNIAVVFAGNADLAESVCEECRAFGVKAEKYSCDVSNFQATKELTAKVKEDFGTVNILINNAGITRDGLIAMMKEQDFDDVIATNLKGVFNMIRSCSSIFIRNKGGKIVNMSSVSGLMGNAGQVNYSASKAGVVGITKSVAKELAPRGITCNAVAPGFINTDMTKNLSVDPEEIAKAIPLGRMGTPEDVADAVVFLVKADYITGEVIRVDGGIAM